jgi:hypothetical protein
LPLNLPKSANGLQCWKKPPVSLDREVPRVRREKGAIRALRALPVHRAKAVCRVLKALTGQKEKKAIQVLRAPPARRVKEASQVPKDHRDQEEKKAIRVLRDPRGPQGQRVRRVIRVLMAFLVRRGNVVSLALKGCRDLQGQREIPQIQIGCNSLRTAFPNWKRDSRHQARKAAVSTED